MFLQWSYLKKIKLVVLDVDGVLTDGKLLYNSEGKISKSFDVKDGLGIKLLQKEGIKVAILSGNKSEATIQRSLDLGISKIEVGVKDKQYTLKKIQEDLNIKKNQTLYIGDDINDLIIIEDIQLLAVPSDAVLSLKKKAHIVLRKKGGNGAVREVSELILKSKNKFKLYTFKGLKETN